MIVKEDVQLKTLANMPYILDDIKIYPLSLNQISEITYSKYIKYLNILYIEKEQLVHPSYIDQIPESIVIYDIIFELFKEDDICIFFIEALKLFLGADEITYVDGELYVDKTKMTIELYHQILEVIKIQNMHKTDKSDNFNPKNERVRLLKEKMMKNKLRIQELKKNSDSDAEELSFVDLISILSSNANGINIFNVFDLNIFQFNDQFNRMKLLDDYEVNIQSLLHGADPQKIKLKHWISKSQF